jgi:uncharacterized protein YlxW (UPF0749 family)
MSTPAPGRQRSLGASLLDQVLAETVDPAYAQAAAARAARAAAAPPDQAPPGRLRRMRGRLLVALTLLIAGLLASITYSEAAAGAQGREQVRAALIRDVERESGVSDRLTAQLEDLRGQVSRTRDQLLAASAVGQRALEQVDRAERDAAAVPVTGPGLLVTLANAAPDSNADPLGGSSAEDPRGNVRDGDLQLVVNALWAAGAEAISINGQRLGPTSAIRFAGEAVLVDFRPVTNPYEVSAIGDPDTLSTTFLASPEVGALAVISESFGLRFEFAKENELSLPAASTPELRSARPLTPDRAAAPDASAPEPSPGG